MIGRQCFRLSLVRETTRQIWGWTLIEDFSRDLRHSLRLLAWSPLFTESAMLGILGGIAGLALGYSVYTLYLS
jgi:hypothetical protein